MRDSGFAQERPERRHVLSGKREEGIDVGSSVVASGYGELLNVVDGASDIAHYCDESRGAHLRCSTWLKLILENTHHRCLTQGSTAGRSKRPWHFMVHGPLHPEVRRPCVTHPKLLAASGLRKTYTEERRDATDAAEPRELIRSGIVRDPISRARQPSWPRRGANPSQHRRRRAPMVPLPRRGSPTRHHRERRSAACMGRGRRRLGFSDDATINLLEGRLTPG